MRTEYATNAHARSVRIEANANESLRRNETAMNLDNTFWFIFGIMTGVILAFLVDTIVKIRRK